VFDDAASQRLVRASVAALICASAAVITSAVIAGREERSAVLVAANGGFAVAAAIFATAGAEAALRSRETGTARGLRPPGSNEALRSGLDRIAAVAQAGTIGDADAAAHAFALIVRHAGECSALIERP